MNRYLLSSAVALVALAASSASADTKSWAALKSNVPTNSEILIGLDVKAMRGASSYGKLVESIAGADKDFGAALALVKQTCSLDLANIVSDVTMSIKTKGPDEFVFAIGLDGVDEAKLLDCAGKVAKAASAKAKITAKSGKVSEYTVDDGKDKHTIYAAWPAKDVVVFSAKPDERAALDPYLSGKAAQGDLATFLGKATTSGTIGWVAATIGEDHMKGAYGSAVLAKGTITGNLHLVTDSATDATKIVGDSKKELQRAQTEAAKSPEIVKILKSIKLATAGADVTVDGAIVEADLPAVLPALKNM